MFKIGDMLENASRQWARRLPDSLLSLANETPVVHLAEPFFYNYASAPRIGSRM